MTTLIAAVCMLTPQIKEGVQSHPEFLLVAFVLSFALLIGLYVKRRESPINLILLAAFVSIELSGTFYIFMFVISDSMFFTQLIQNIFIKCRVYFRPSLKHTQLEFLSPSTTLQSYYKPSS
jgi:FtsH-binding integral membrane protein